MKKEVLDRIQVRMGDITGFAVDAIVNAANPSLLGGAGVDGMIHWAAGDGLLEECRTLGGCPTGEARITGGYNLPSRFVIHTVGPVYKIDGPDAPKLLASCYLNCLRLAIANNITTIAFPAISCGSYGYPAEEACRIALDTVCGFLKSNRTIEKVFFILYKCSDYEIYLNYFNMLND